MKPERFLASSLAELVIQSQPFSISQCCFPSIMIGLGLRFDNKIVASSSCLTSFQVQVQNKNRKNIPSKHHIAHRSCAYVEPIIVSKGNPVLCLVRPESHAYCQCYTTPGTWSEKGGLVLLSVS